MTVCQWRGLVIRLTRTVEGLHDSAAAPAMATLHEEPEALCMPTMSAVIIEYL